MHKITNELGKRINLVGREFSLISSWGYGDLNFDAVFKWANIIHEFHS